MRLLRIRLANYRGTQAREITFPQTGTVVVAGPNEAGKSSLIQAFHLALKYKDTSRAAEVREIQPLGTDLPTEIEVEFEVAGYHLVLNRRYHRETSTRLQVLTPQPEDLAGREADERLGAILDSKLDADLVEALHIGQDERQVEQARPNPWGGAMADVLNAGKESGGCRLDTTLVDLAATERAIWFTPTGREGKGLKELGDRVRKAEQLLEQVRLQQADLDACVEEHEATQAECEKRSERKRHIEGELAGLARRRSQFEEAVRRCELAGGLARESAAHEEAAGAALAARQDLAARVDKWESHIAELTRLDAEGEGDRTAAANEAAELRASAKCAADSALEADERAEAAAALARRAELADRLATTKAQLTGEQARLVADVIEGAPRVFVESLGATAIAIDGLEVELDGVNPLVLIAERPQVIELPGSVRIRVEPGAAAEGSRAAAEESGGIVIARLEETVERLSSELLALGGDPSLSPSEVGEVANRLASLARQGREQAAAALSAATRAEAAADESQRVHERHVDQLGQANLVVEDDRRALNASRAEADDVALADAVAQAAEKSRAAQAQLDQCEAEVRELSADSLPTRVEGLEQDLADVDSALTAGRERLSQLAERARLLSDQGLHTRLQDAQIELDTARQMASAERRRAEVANRLWATLDKHRKEAETAYRDPLRSRIEELGQSLLGPTFSVEMDHDLTVSRRRLDGHSVPVDQLSAGAREQLALLGRIACASLAAKEGAGAPLILDDTLGYSDPVRRSGVVKVLNEATGGCQVIILTCDAERYADLVGAKRIDL